MQVGIEQCAVVVPTIGRPSLDVLLDALAQAPGPRPAELVLVDDRPTGEPLRPERPGLPPVRVVRTGGGGPARARNLGWRAPRPGGDALLPGHGRPPTHPVRPADGWISVRVQAGNADDVLMRRLHGPGWRDRADAALGRRPRHTAVTAAGLTALGLAAGRRPR